MVVGILAFTPEGMEIGPGGTGIGLAPAPKPTSGGAAAADNEADVVVDDDIVSHRCAESWGACG